MAYVTIRGIEYEIIDEAGLLAALEAEDTSDSHAKGALIELVLANTVWMVSGYVLGKILDRMPELFRKKERF